MDQLKNTATIFDNTVKGWMSVIDNNEYLTAALIIFLIVYASYAAPKLPPYILHLFDNPLFKLLIFFLIVYSAKKNPTVAIIAAVALMVSIHALNKLKLDQMMMRFIEQDRERMANISYNPMAEYQGIPKPANELVMEHVTHPESSMNMASIEELREENKSEPGSENIDQNEYKNGFYPQYANVKQEAYLGAFTGNNVGGFDPQSAYASI
jgi:hypothetical protein